MNNFRTHFDISGPKQHLHFRDLADLGSAPLALIAHQAGHRVTGIARRDSRVVDNLRALGIEIVVGDEWRFPSSCTMLVGVTDLALAHNVANWTDTGGRPVIHPVDLMIDIANAHKVRIAVTGTSGKSTTTSMLAHVLSTADMNPTFAINALPREFPCGHWGDGGLFIAEVHEQFRGLLDVNWTHGIITDLDRDHGYEVGGCCIEYLAIRD